eukprot:930855-Amphidinium_carterae.1
MKDWMNYTMNIVYDYSARDETWERGAIGMATFFACFTAWCLYEDCLPSTRNLFGNDVYHVSLIISKTSHGDTAMSESNAAVKLSAWLPSGS